GRLHWFAADVSVPAGLVAVVLTATVGYAVVVGVSATRNALADPLGVRRLAPLAAGLGAVALGATWTGAEPRARFWLVLGGMLLTGLGLVPALPFLGY